MFCVPACKGCREAGSCPKGELPASAYAPPAKRTGPRRAVAPTYPRDVKQVYLHLACGGITTKEAQLFYSVWRPRDDEAQPQLYCEVHHHWTTPEIIEKSEPTPFPNF